MTHRHAVVLAAGLALQLAAVFAAAQDGGAEAEAAKVAFEKGKALVDEGKYAEAADAFREANAIQPSWKIQYNIGQCEMMAKRHALALEAFERYLSEGGEDIEAERREEVLADAVRLREMVGFVDVRVADGARVLVNDVERGVAPLPGPLAVDAGIEHQVVARAGDAVLLDRVVRVSGGQTVVVEASEDAAGGGPAGSGDGEDGEPASGRAAWGWTATGVGAALMIAGGVTGGLALYKNSELRDACSDGDCLTEQQHDDVDTRDRLATSSTVLLATGAAVAVVGVLLLTVFDGEEDAAVTVSFDGVTLGGRF